MKLLFEDLQFWSVTTNRLFIHQAYEKAKKILEEKIEPIIDWCESDYIDVRRGDPIIPTQIKNFKQSKRTLSKKVKKPRKKVE